MTISGFEKGVNLGGWISQYGEFSRQRFENFIKEKDVARIASWGFDHVRLPVDAPVLLKDEKDFVLRKEGFEYIDRCLKWCRKNNLNLVLDLHKAPGYSFSSLKDNTLFSSEKMQSNFISLWQELTERYQNEKDNLIFELLNEVVDEKEGWNKLAHETIKAIRKLDETRKIIYGGPNYNAVTSLKDIALIEDDPHIIYTFHYYLPFMFTHQKASWTDLTSSMDFDVNYPGPNPELVNFLNKNNDDPSDQKEAAVFNKEFLKEKFEPARKFKKENDCQLYCGEYGVIGCAPRESRENWYRDFTDIINELEISRAVWSYKEMNFGLVDQEGNVVNQKIVDIISQ